MDKNLYITFHVTADAIATDLAAEENHIDGKLVPVPRVLSSGCGMAWRGNVEDQEKTLELLEKEAIEWEDVAIL